jgi:hypothetical protein
MDRSEHCQAARLAQQVILIRRKLGRGVAEAKRWRGATS